MKQTAKELTRCRQCGRWVNPALGADPPNEHQEAAGTKRDPRAPGDWDDICAHCNYAEGLRGGPRS